MNPKILFFLLLPLPVLPAQAGSSLAVRTGTLYVKPGKAIPRGVLLVRDGKVFALGRNLAVPSGARVLDWTDRIVAPGRIDGWTQASTAGEGGELSTAWTPALKAADALDPLDPIWRDFASRGITSVVVTPDPSQVAGGLACLVKTGSRPKVAEGALFLQFSLTSRARRRDRPPTSLAGQAARIREGLRNVRARKDATLEGKILSRALAGKLPVLFACETPAEVQAALRLAGEFRLPKVLFALPSACRPLPVLLEGTETAGLFLAPPSREAPAWSLRLPALLARRGLPPAFASASPAHPPLELRLLPALAVRYGLPRREALAAVTTRPARMLDLSWRIGSLELGRDADFVAFDGDPLDPGSRVLAAYVEGRPAWTASSKKKENRK